MRGLDSSWRRSRAPQRTLPARFALVLCALAGPAVARAQRSAECATIECAASQDARSGSSPVAESAAARAWATAATLHQHKLRFVEALQRVTRAQVGTFGDEGRDLAAGVAVMRFVLREWDAGLRALESEEVPAGADRATLAEWRAARGTAYLDRYRFDDALRMLGEAARLDPERADVPRLEALAYTALGRQRDAARAFSRAAARDPMNVAVAYAHARAALRVGQVDEARRGFARVSQLADARGSGRGTGEPGARAPFERVELLRQPGGVGPVFPRALYADAYAALDRGDLAAAVGAFDRAIPRDPLNGGWPATREMVARGAAELRAGAIDAAIASLGSAVETAPDDSDAHRALALALLVGERPTDAAAAAATASRRQPSDERARLLLAEALRADGRDREADAALEEAVAAVPRGATARYLLGERHRLAGRVPQAIDAMRTAAQSPPVVGRDYLFFTIGRLNADRADFNGAVDAYLARIDANPNSAEAHRQLGEIYFVQGRDEDALAEFSLATYLEPTDTKVQAGLGQTLLRMKRPAEAASVFARAIASGSDDPAVHYGLGSALLRSGKPVEAKAALAVSERRRAEEAAEGQRAFRIDRLGRSAVAEREAGRHDAAVALLAEVLTLDPTSGRWRREMGLTLMAANRAREAIEHLERVQQRDSTLDGALALAEAYDRVGDVAARARSLAERDRLVAVARRARLELLAGGR